MSEKQEEIIKRIQAHAAKRRRRRHEEIPLRPEKTEESDEKKEEALIKRAKKLKVPHCVIQGAIVEGNRAGRVSRN